MRAILSVIAALGLHAETGYDAWLRYAPLDHPAALPAVITSVGESPLIASAREEMIRGVRGMSGRTLRVEQGLPHESAIVLGTLSDLQQTAPELGVAARLQPDAFAFKTVRVKSAVYAIVAASNPRGVLYGTFALLRKIGLGESIANLDEQQTPSASLRWVNHWDNLDGSIERGYGGRSIFWDKEHARSDLSRVTDYGRQLASIGINACAINSVNANPLAITSKFIANEVTRVAAAFRPWGIQVVLSVDLGSPKTIGGLDTFDPLDARVIAWWKAKVDEIEHAVPDLAGILIKADSEGRVGPSTYGRTHADAANVIARALKPYGGYVFYRGFVYDHHMDWNNAKNDRARAAYDNFHDLDGKFEDNVVIQIKHGPIDFQVREPTSPLFGALSNTKQAIELQITQEYFGQGRHTVFLIPMWKETLDFDMHAHGAGTPVKSLVTGYAGVSNAGLDQNWFSNEMSQANLYGFGRLAWNPDLTSQRIIDEWTRLTFGNDPKVIETVNRIQLSSWRTYENYTGPLGLQTLTAIVGDHYGVAVEASERNGWGQWHRADEHGVGMDRTEATGTGYIGQYKREVARIYESLKSCPDDLLLFMHHVPYTYVLHDGKTVIQYIYDSHYEGLAAVERYVDEWKRLKGRVDDERYYEVLAQLEYQAGQAEVWRDAVSNWFLHASGIADARGRVGHYPGRVEAESMTLNGYKAEPVDPWEAASGGKAVVCPAEKCTASYRYEGEPGWSAIRIRYFDQNNGVSHFKLMVGSQLVDEWAAADLPPTKKINASSSSVRVVHGIALRRGDEIRIEGIPDGAEAAPLDYIEIKPER